MHSMRVPQCSNVKMCAQHPDDNQYIWLQTNEIASPKLRNLIRNPNLLASAEHPVGCSEVWNRWRAVRLKQES